MPMNIFVNLPVESLPASKAFFEKLGFTIYKEPKDHGFMYEHGLEDLDGHIWEVVHMEPGAISPQS